jgi:tetratricopeptide (TPR) repeat protein
MVRNTNYANDIELHKHDAEVQPNYRTELALAHMYVETNDRKEALGHLEKSVRLYRTKEGLSDLGLFRELAGDIKQASEFYLEAYELEKSKGRKVDKPLYQRLSNAMLLRGDFATASRISQEGLTYFPEDDQLWYQLAVAESALQNYTAASYAIEKAISINPSERYETMRQAIRGEHGHSAQQL